MKKLTIIAQRPANIPEGWKIHAAHRHLYGTETWFQSDRGHFAAIDPSDGQAERFERENESLQAFESATVFINTLRAAKFARYVLERLTHRAGLIR